MFPRRSEEDNTAHHQIIRNRQNSILHLIRHPAVIYEIIFDQTSRTIFSYFRRDLPHSTFTRVRGERSDIPEGPPDYDSDGNEIISEADYFSWEEVDTDEESE